MAMYVTYIVHLSERYGMIGKVVIAGKRYKGSEISYRLHEV